MSPVVICQKCGPWAMEALEAISKREPAVRCNGIPVPVESFFPRFRRAGLLLGESLNSEASSALRYWQTEKAHGRMA